MSISNRDAYLLDKYRDVMERLETIDIAAALDADIERLKTNNSASAVMAAQIIAATKSYIYGNDIIPDLERIRAAKKRPSRRRKVAQL